MAIVVQKLTGVVTGSLYVVTICPTYDNVGLACVPSLDGDGNTLPNPEFQYPSATPIAGDARTTVQWQAACDAEAVALVAAVLAQGGVSATEATDTMTVLN